MGVGEVGCDAATRRTIEETFLEQERLDDFFEGRDIFGGGCREGRETDGTACEFFDHGAKRTTICFVETARVNIQSGER